MIATRLLMSVLLGCAGLAAPNVWSGHGGVAQAQDRVKAKAMKGFESEYEKWTEMLDLQISRNHVYPSDVKRARSSLQRAIAIITRDGASEAQATYRRSRHSQSRERNSPL